MDRRGRLSLRFDVRSGGCLIVLMAGLPGTGKSTLAKAIAQGVAGVVLDKDAVRAVLFPESLTAYTCTQDDFVIQVMLSTAEYLLRQSRASRISRWTAVQSEVSSGCGCVVCGTDRYGVAGCGMRLF